MSFDICRRELAVVSRVHPSLFRLSFFHEIYKIDILDVLLADIQFHLFYCFERLKLHFYIKIRKYVNLKDAKHDIIEW